MPPVPVFSDRPIIAAQAADDVPTKTTDQPPQVNRNLPAAAPATTTASASSTLPSARPGAPAMPAPTGSAHLTNPQPTRTSAAPGSNTDGPPPPQPGAVPTPPTQSSVESTSTSNGPWAPQPGTAPSHTMPSQYSLPPPTQNQAATHSTSLQNPNGTTISFGVVGTGAGAQPTSLRETGASATLAHPPGYVQDPFASEMTSGQREAARRSEEAGRSSLGGVLGESSGAMAGGDGVWDTAKKWALAAGEKASELEAEVWKRVNGDK